LNNIRDFLLKSLVARAASCFRPSPVYAKSGGDKDQSWDDLPGGRAGSLTRRGPNFSYYCGGRVRI
jgi:hypothetical protein